MARLLSNGFGKHRDRVLKFLRNTDENHRVCEWEVDVLLSGLGVHAQIITKAGPWK